jgi:hypothetical protein
LARDLAVSGILAVSQSGLTNGRSQLYQPLYCFSMIIRKQ